jgi:membrane protein
VQRLRATAEWGKRKYSGSWAGHLWSRLAAVDFMNRAMLLAATLLLCAIPFLIIVAALAGHSAASTLSHRLGLNQQAATDVNHLIASAGTTSATVTGLSSATFVLGGLAAASTIKELYLRVFDLQPVKWDRLRVLVWLALGVGAMFLTSAVGPTLRASWPGLLWIAMLVGTIGFFWFSIWFLLAGRVSWRRLLPCAIATGICWVGMVAVFSVIFSNMIISGDQRYGAIGTIFALMSLLIAIGVVIILGAEVGLMWNDRGHPSGGPSGSRGGSHG